MKFIPSFETKSPKSRQRFRPNVFRSKSSRRVSHSGDSCVSDASDFDTLVPYSPLADERMPMKLIVKPRIPQQSAQNPGKREALTRDNFRPSDYYAEMGRLIPIPRSFLDDTCCYGPHYVSDLRSYFRKEFFWNMSVAARDQGRLYEWMHRRQGDTTSLILQCGDPRRRTETGACQFMLVASLHDVDTRALEKHVEGLSQSSDQKPMQHQMHKKRKGKGAKSKKSPPQQVHAAPLANATPILLHESIRKLPSSKRIKYGRREIRRKHKTTSLDYLQALIDEQAVATPPSWLPTDEDIEEWSLEKEKIQRTSGVGDAQSTQLPPIEDGVLEKIDDKQISSIYVQAGGTTVNIDISRQTKSLRKDQSNVRIYNGNISSISPRALESRELKKIESVANFKSLFSISSEGDDGSSIFY